MMTEIEFTVEPIELAIEDFFEYHDFDRIQCVDDLMEQLHDYLNDVGLDRDFNLDNIINYYNIDDLDELDDRFIANYDNDDEMDSKIELIDTIIKLVLINEWIEPCGAFDEDEFADDEE